MYKKSHEMLVGLLIILAALSFVFLAFKASGLSFQSICGQKTYTVTASFESIGALNKNAAVRIAGVQIGKVSDISLNNNSFKAQTILTIDQKFNDIPSDSSASIETMGILGDSYIALQPGYKETVLKNNSTINTTYSATNLSSLLSTFTSGGKPK
tara:strand:- start:211 stop:675 length:465 start_codon:yes stop_codon:yes gene_type:complete